MLEALAAYYNQRGPHSKLGWLAPQAYAQSPCRKRRAACCAG
ncbi:hypothetical protein [Brevundimonas sp. S1H14]